MDYFDDSILWLEHRAAFYRRTSLILLVLAGFALGVSIAVWLFMGEANASVLISSGSVMLAVASVVCSVFYKKIYLELKVKRDAHLDEWRKQIRNNVLNSPL